MIRVGILRRVVGSSLGKRDLGTGHVRLTTTTESKLSQLLAKDITKLLKLNESSVTGDPDFFEILTPF